MKVIKRKNGYSIRCNDGDFALLQGIVAMAENAQDVLVKNLPAIAKTSYTRRCGKKHEQELLRIDEDRRAAE